MKKTIVILMFCIVYFWTVNAYGDWWEEADAGNELDQRMVSPSENRLAPPSSAVRVNWVDEYVEVMAGGTADPDRVISEAHAVSVATKTARHLAYEKLAETISGINITSDAVYNRELMIDSNLQTSVEALIRGAQVVEERHDRLHDGSIWAQVRLGIHLQGEGNSLMASSKPWMQTNLSPEAQVTIEDPARKAVEKLAEGQPEAVQEEITGIIIDAGGMEVKPAMAPAIYSRNGTLIYGFHNVDEDYVVQHGLAGYAQSVEDAKNMSRVGDNPLVVKADSVRGNNSCDVVLTNEDAARISAASMEKPFLQECRVVFVVN